jgi:LysM repeat protein
MSSLRQVIFGTLAAILSSAIVMGSFMLAFTEGTEVVGLVPTPTPETISIIQQTSPTPGLPTLTVLPGDPTHTAAPTLEPTSTPTSADTETTAHSSTTCTYPAGWNSLAVQPGDTLNSIAAAYSVTTEALLEANCLVIDALMPGSLLYVPGLPPTPAPIQCGPPRSWVTYVVRQGDNLYQLSRILGVSVAQLQSANCLGSSTLIRTGQRLYVPRQPAAVPNPTGIPPALPSPLPTMEPTPVPSPMPTGEATVEPTLEPTTDPTIEPTDESTVEPTGEPTLEPTEEPTADPTEVPISEPTQGATDEPDPSPEP